jgi:hypothetical protein
VTGGNELFGEAVADSPVATGDEDGSCGHVAPFGVLTHPA